MKILITGGAGFIGINAMLHFARRGHQITVFDNLNKTGLVPTFYKYLEAFPTIKFIKGDIRDRNCVDLTLSDVEYDAIIHLAGQTAVTKSVEDPINDFENNAVGTFNMLEATKLHQPIRTKFIYASTNKVYGNLSRFRYTEGRMAYTIPESDCINEDEPLDFYSPYGCSKGTGDQYVRDYGRIYDIETYVVRQSCIYGWHQDGTEDQGWVAWFVKAFLEQKPITIYGNGKQVRDLLHVKDLLRFYEMLLDGKGTSRSVYNLGGGYQNTVSLLELISMLTIELGKAKEIKYTKERPGDQKIFISGNKRAKLIGWEPQIPVKAGLQSLINFYQTGEKRITVYNNF